MAWRRRAAPASRASRAGALSGAFIAGIISSLDAFVLQAPGAPLTRAPFLLNVGVRSLVYLVVFLLIIPAGNWLLPSPGSQGTIGIRATTSCTALPSPSWSPSCSR